MFEVYDFAPRFVLYDRYTSRRCSSASSARCRARPRAVVRCRPTYSTACSSRRRGPRRTARPTAGSRLRAAHDERAARVRQDERPFLVERDRHLVLTWGQPLEAGLEDTAERFLERTLDYWQLGEGTRVPRDYQAEVIRSALVLKLHRWEDTGALLAATTTSIPEHRSGRSWDYRYCWLRDAYFTLNALERLGHSEEMERFLEYLRNLAEEREACSAAYRINARRRHRTRARPLDRFGGEKPVRVGNQAFEHVQNDVYGEMVLAISRLFLDQRFVGSVPPRTAIETVEELVAQIGYGSRAGRRPVGVPRAHPAAHLYSCSCTGPARSGRSRSRTRSAPRSSRHALGTWRRERPRSSRSSAGTT